MRLLILLAAVTLPALADPFQFSVDGVGYNWNYDAGSNTAGTIQVQFSAPISLYAFSVTFPSAATNPQIWVGTQYTPTINWTQTQGPWAPGGAIANVHGSLAGATSLDITIGVDSSVGPLFPVYFNFGELVDPPVMVVTAQVEAPEPSTLTLIVCGLALTMLTSTSGQWHKSRLLMRKLKITHHLHQETGFRGASYRLCSRS